MWLYITAKTKPITIYNKIKSTVQRIDFFFQRYTQIKLNVGYMIHKWNWCWHTFCAIFSRGVKRILEIDFMCMFVCNLSIKCITNYSTINVGMTHIQERFFLLHFFYSKNNWFSIFNYKKLVFWAGQSLYQMNKFYDYNEYSIHVCTLMTW